MNGNIRPADMKRINTPELAEAFIAEQVAQVRAQVGDKKVLLALSGGLRPCEPRPDAQGRKRAGHRGL